MYFDFSYSAAYNTLEEYLTLVNLDLKYNIEMLYPNSKILKNYDSKINKNLIKWYFETGVQFVIIIDEWDYIISNKLYTDEKRNKYISFFENFNKKSTVCSFYLYDRNITNSKKLGI